MTQLGYEQGAFAGSRRFIRMVKEDFRPGLVCGVRPIAGVGPKAAQKYYREGIRASLFAKGVTSKAR
jgi:hypothetical protein